MNKLEQIQIDQNLIKELGGTTVIAKKLNVSKQRVNNWFSRGIPALIKLTYPNIFLKRKIKNAKITTIL
jgi:hypothetical protein